MTIEVPRCFEPYRLGHVSINTTNVHAEVDLEMKAKALAHWEVQDSAPHRP